MTPLLFGDFLTRNNRAMEKAPKTERARITLRLPPELHAEITEAAARAGHSANDEIVFRLEAHAKAQTLNEIAQQNARTQEMIQRLINTLC